MPFPDGPPPELPARFRGRPKIDADVEASIRAALRRKDRPGFRVIAAKHGVSTNTVQRIAHAR